MYEPAAHAPALSVRALTKRLISAVCNLIRITSGEIDIFGADRRWRPRSSDGARGCSRPVTG